MVSGSLIYDSIADFHIQIHCNNVIDFPNLFTLV